ncbi:MAG: GGDEF domain-containing response regulator [Smithella sp.]|nr:GGDEF domain-containing response regulator [Smithella sp.]
MVDTKRDISILIVDDDESVLRTISKILKFSDQSYFIETATTVEKLLDLVKKTYWDTILLDLSIPNHEGDNPDPKNGIQALERLRSEYNVNTPIIAITGYKEDELSDTVLDKGAYYFLEKPVRAKYLSAIVKNSTRFQMSGFDGLTGLLNRKTFEERLKSEFERAIRKNTGAAGNKGGDNNKSCLSLIYLDGDNFKLINDTYSHLVGDMVLKKIGSSFIDESVYKPIAENGHAYKFIIRPYDLAARFGGDEFCIFLPETDHPSALTVARRIRDMMKNIDIAEIVGRDKIAGIIPEISVSIGIATYPSPNNVATYEELITLADRAMYGSKMAKRGHIFGYNHDGSIVNCDQ